MPRTELIVESSKPLADRQALVVAHTLLVAAEHILCPIRLLGIIKDSPRNPAWDSMYWYLFVAICGSLAEMRVRLRKPPYRTVVATHVATHAPSLQPVFERLTADCLEDDPLLWMCKRIRDKYWAHWDEDVSQRYVDQLKLDGSDDAFAATDGATTIEEIGIPWVRKAWFLDLDEHAGGTEENVEARTKELTDLWRAAAKLAREGANGIIRASGCRMTVRES